MLSEVSCSISPGCHREVKQKCGQNWSNGSRFEVGSSLHLVYAWSIRMPSAATKKSKTLTQTDILDSQCISSSHLKLFLVFSWWQNIWSSFWHYMLYVHYWQDMRVCFRISLSSEWRIYFPRSLQRVFSLSQVTCLFPNQLLWPGSAIGSTPEAWVPEQLARNGVIINQQGPS